MKKIYTSIDIGSDTIKFVVAELYKEKLHILHSSSIKSKGIRKGLIIDSNLMVNSIKDGIKVVSNDLGFQIKKVIVNVPSYNAKFMYVTNKIEINEEITTEDINKVIKSSVYGKIDSDYELVTVLPLEFVINESDSVEYPVGLKANTLEIKGIMITVPKKNIFSVVSVMESAGLEVVDITLSGLSDYSEVKRDNIKNKVGAIINIGHDITNVSVFNKGKLMNTEVLQIGGHNVEKDIAYVFGINVIDARTIKEKFSFAHKRFVTLTDTYEIKNNDEKLIKIGQLEVTEVVMSRLTEILNYAKKQILLLTKKNIEYIIITGGTTEMKYFKNLVYEILGKDVIIYLMKDIGIRDNKYISAFGSIKYFIEKMTIRGKDYSMISPLDEELLLTPESKTRRDKVGIAGMFKNFGKNKEEK
ncbi:cell division protein ftsA [Clostridium sp. CAG:914]|jgi:cell division protein FtsA|nr:cell division protein ftsA [Clostridium sp. CAG:914]